MKKQAVTTNRLGMLQYFLDNLVQVATNIEQSQTDEEGNVHYAKLAYQGVLLDFDDTWAVLGYYNDNDVPTVVTSIKLDSIVAIGLGGDVEEHSDMSSAEVN